MFNYLIGTALMRAVFGAKFDTATFQKCLGLISFVLIALFITGAGLFRSHVLEAQLAQLANEATRARAEVVDKSETWRNNSSYYEFSLEFAAVDGARHRGHVTTQNAQLGSTRIGASLPILYVRSAPDTVYLVGEEPTEAGLAFMRNMFRVGLVSLALTLGLLVWQWPRSEGGGGAPIGRVAPPSAPRPSAPVSQAVVRNDGPPVFGKRR